MGSSEGEEKEKATESVFKTIMTENFLNLGKEMDIQIHEAQTAPNRLNRKRATPRHTIIQLSKDKDFSKQPEKKTSSIQGNHYSQDHADFSRETFQARREWDDILKIL